MPKKIVVIDNDPDFVEALVTVLDANGYETVSATDGDAAFAVIKEQRPDLVLLDVMMRSVSEGLDIASKLLDDSSLKNVPVVLITGIRKADLLAESYRPGEGLANVRMTLEKPVKPDELIRAVKSIIG